MPTSITSVALAATLALLPVVAGATITANGVCEGVPSGVKLHVIVDGTRSNKGVMTATLYGGNADKYLKHGGELKVWRVDAQSPSTPMCAWLPGPGTYSVAIYHDAKRAYRFVLGTFGPTQDYGFSRDPHLFFGPPSFNQTKFTVTGADTTIHIRLKYP